MNEISAPQWYVVQTQPRREFDARVHLVRQGFDVYLPRYQKRRSHARKVDIVAAPLFPRYAFVRIDPLQQPWRAIRSTVGVVDLLCQDGRPLPLRGGFVTELRRCEVNGLVRLADRRPFLRGESVRVLDGVFANHIGLVDGMSDDQRVAVLLTFLGREMRVVLDAVSVAAA